MVVVDTNIIIDHLRSRNDRDTLLLQIARAMHNEKLGISVISLQELYEGQSTREKEKEEQLLAVTSPLLLLPYTVEIAKLVGTIARDLKRPIELADAAIAASAIAQGARLATLNKKDFQGIPNLWFFEFE